MDASIILVAATSADLQRLVGQVRELLQLDGDGRRISYRPQNGLEVIRFAATAAEAERCRAAMRAGQLDGTVVAEVDVGGLLLHPSSLGGIERDAIQAILAQN